MLENIRSSYETLVRKLKRKSQPFHFLVYKHLNKKELDDQR
jgi:hypothetical protein